MRAFVPSLVSLLAAVLWLGITTTVLPAGDDPSACTTATMLGRMPEIPEASGLAVSRRNKDLLWTHNDSGQPILYGVGMDGHLRARVRINGADVEDWEDLAIASCGSTSCLYIADIGDNKASRRQIAVYRVPEPALGEEATASVEALYATYPDGPQDAEALFVSPNGTIYVVTKGEGSPITLYRFPASVSPGATVPLERVMTLAQKANRQSRVTDADISPDGKWVALRTLEAVQFFRASALLSGKSEPPVAANLSRLGEPQGEGIAMLSDGTVFLAGEARDGLRGGTLARASCKLP